MIKQKRSMTSFDVAAVVERFRELTGFRLANIYDYPDRRGVLLKFKGGTLVAAVPSERAHITKYALSDKGMPSPFVMGLRKYLRDAKLKEVLQHCFDRILIFVFERGNATYNLIVELLPRGVLALVDENSVILQVSEERKMRDRVLRIKAKYEFPPSQTVHPKDLNEAIITNALDKGRDIESIRVLSRELGYPGEVVEEALLRVGLKPSTPAADAVKDAASIANALKGVYEECLGGKGYIVYYKGKPLTVTCFEPRGIADFYKLTVRGPLDVNEALDEYFAALLKEAALEAADELERERGKLLASLQAALENLRRLEEKVKSLEAKAVKLAEHVPLLYEAYECARRLRERSGWESIPGNCPGVVDVDPHHGIIRVSVAGEIIDLDIRRAPDSYIVDLYKRIGELKSKIERGRQAVKEVEEKLRELEEKVRERRARLAARVRKREWYEKYHWLITSNGYLAIGGRDASQNESIVKRYLNDKRIFMHADVHGAPAVVLFAEGRQPPQDDLKEAALLTAAYSKAWKAGMGFVDVYWVWGSQVSKSPPPGEYLARGAFMVYGKRNYIRGVELKIAIGIGVEDGKPVAIVGPDYLVKRRSVVYTVLVPGDEDPSKLAKRLKRSLSEKAPSELKPIIEAVPVEELRERIPGRARVIYVGRGEGREKPRPLRVLHEEKE